MQIGRQTVGLILNYSYTFLVLKCKYHLLFAALKILILGLPLPKYARLTYRCYCTRNSRIIRSFRWRFPIEYPRVVSTHSPPPLLPPYTKTRPYNTNLLFMRQVLKDLNRSETNSSGSDNIFIRASLRRILAFYAHSDRSDNLATRN